MTSMKPFAALLLLLLACSPVLAFKAGQSIDPSCHEVLTLKTLDFFNESYPGILTFTSQMGGKTLSQWIRNGVRDADGLDETDAQDQESGDYLNHFHLPDVTASAVTAKTGGNDALEWVFGDNQSNRFRWKEAVHDYRLEGNRHQGFYALGHCLHVLQDMASPPNVRLDPFGLDSPFDAYTADKGAVEMPAGTAPPASDDPRQLMENLAIFTNSGFFSTNTTRKSLSWSFPHPHPVREEVEVVEDRRYRTLVGRDAKGTEYRLGRVSLMRSHSTSQDISNPVVPHVLSAHVMEDYYNILSVEAVRCGAALIKNFINYATVVLESVPAGDITPSSITLRWQKNIDPDFLSYSVYRTIDGVSFTLRTTITEQSTISWTDTLLSANSVYRYRVNVKFRSDNVEGVSNVVEARTTTEGDTAPPTPILVTAYDGTTLIVQYSEAVSRPSAENLDNYFLTGGVNLSSLLYAELSDDGRTVTITTTTMEEGSAYMLRIQGVMDLSGNVMNGSTTLQFTGIAPPEVVSAQALTSTAIEVLFSEAVTTATAQVPGNYSIYPYLTIDGAVLQTGGSRVHLQSSSQSSGIRYTLTVENVQDLKGHTIGTSNTASFQGGY